MINFSVHQYLNRVAPFIAAQILFSMFLIKPSEDVQMKLLYSICVPCATYACDVIDYSNKDKQSLHVALNDAIRKIFGYDRWQSIKDIRESFGYQSITEIFAKSKTNFERSLPSIGNSVLTFLQKLWLCWFFFLSLCSPSWMLFRIVSVSNNLIRIKDHIYHGL